MKFISCTNAFGGKRTLHHHNAEVLEHLHGCYLAKGTGFALSQLYRSLLAINRKS